MQFLGAIHSSPFKKSPPGTSCAVSRSPCRFSIETSSKVISLLVFFFISFRVFAIADSTKLPKAVDIPYFYQEALKKDFPIKEAVFSDSKTLWILGNHFLWQFDFQKRRLHKYYGFESKPNDYSQILYHDNSIWLLGAEKIAKFPKNSTDLIEFKIPIKDKFLNFFVSNNKLYGITFQNLLLIDKEDITILDWESFPSLTGKEIFYFDSDKMLIYEESQTIYSYHLPSKKKKKLFQSAVPFLGIKQYQEQLFAYTPYSLTVLSGDGFVVETIPLEGDHKITHGQFSKFHYFLLNDGMIERHNLPLKESSYYFTSEPLAHNITIFTASPLFFAMFSINEVFFLEF